MFDYAYEMDLIDRPIKYGRVFDRPSKTEKRKARRSSETKNGKRLFEPVDIKRMLDESEGSLHAMILLGINAGFGNTDCARLPVSAVDLKMSVITFPRPETDIERVAPLWPETQEALQGVIANRPKTPSPKLPATAGSSTPRPTAAASSFVAALRAWTR
jgi:integrase